MVNVESDNKSFGCCLLEILAVLAVIVLFFIDTEERGYYFVEETGYVHSTKKGSKCPFVKDASKKEYHITKIEKYDAITKEAKICKSCYTDDEQKEYNEMLGKYREMKPYYDDSTKWREINNKTTDFSNLYVYIEDNGKLHIYGMCVEKTSLTRVPLSEVSKFDVLCQNCVDVEYTEFIYKAVYEGIYDAELIRESEEDIW